MSVYATRIGIIHYAYIYTIDIYSGSGTSTPACAPSARHAFENVCISSVWIYIYVYIVLLSLLIYIVEACVYVYYMHIYIWVRLCNRFDTHKLAWTTYYILLGHSPPLLSHRVSRVRMVTVITLLYISVSDRTGYSIHAVYWRVFSFSILYEYKYIYTNDICRCYCSSLVQQLRQ